MSPQLLPTFPDIGDLQSKAESSRLQNWRPRSCVWVKAERFMKGYEKQRNGLFFKTFFKCFIF